MKRYLPFLLAFAYLLCLSASVKAQDKQPAYIHLICAPNAKVTINGQDTHSTGIFRRFETEPFSGTGTEKIDVCNGDRCNTYTITLTAGQTTLLTAIQSLKEVQGMRDLGLGHCGYCKMRYGTCAAGQCAAGCPNGQCSPRAAFQGFQFLQGGGCANGQCGSAWRGN